MRRSHRLPRLRHRLGRRHERWLYLTGGTLLLSGIGWLISHYLLHARGPFGDVAHPSEPWWMRLHGAAVIAFLLVLGALLPGHVVMNWRRRANVRSGLTVVTGVAVLTLSGYGLYYAVGDDLRAWISVVHWVVGLAAGAALTVHAVLGKRTAKQNRERRASMAKSGSNAAAAPARLVP